MYDEEKKEMLSVEDKDQKIKDNTKALRSSRSSSLIPPSLPQYQRRNREFGASVRSNPNASIKEEDEGKAKFKGLFGKLHSFSFYLSKVFKSSKSQTDC